jgi:hypothetical protein
MAEVIKKKISEIKLNPENPRIIKDDKFQKLVQSIKNFPEMLEIRPIVVNSEMIILGGNMRYKACVEAGLKTVPIIIADNLTEEQQREFLIKDNVSGGEWDFEVLRNEWDNEKLDEWGLDLPGLIDDDGTYTTKVESPIYEPKGEKPKESELYNLGKYNELMDKINASNLSDEKKLFLQFAATRHIEFNYGKIAEFYSHEDKEAQELMEDSALVIIDYNKAIELGFVKLFDDLEKFSEIDE